LSYGAASNEQVTDDEMDRTCIGHKGMRNLQIIFVWKLKRRNHFLDWSRYGRIILIWILKSSDWIELIQN
jgi:hypothetical protein